MGIPAKKSNVLVFLILFAINKTPGLESSPVQIQDDPRNEKDPPVTDVSVGANVTFICDLSYYNNIVWYINYTYYDRDMLPDDYYYEVHEENFLFTIKNAKLWMNNTNYKCYDVQSQKYNWFAKVVVDFDMQGPTNEQIELQAPLYFIPCNTSSIDNDPLIVHWSINGIIETKPSEPFYQKQHGLLIKPINESLNGTSFQCLIYSKMLLKDGYYYSSVGTITLTQFSSSGTFYKNICNREAGICDTSDSFTFFYGGFILNNITSEYTISWNEAESCPEPYHYQVMGISEEKNYTRTVYGTSMTLNKEELMLNGSLYEIYVQAVTSTNSTCSRSTYFIKVSPKVMTEYIERDPESNYCLKNITNDHNKEITFPNQFNNEGCSCSNLNIIKNCSCVVENLTVFNNIYNRGDAICLGNLSADLNGTYLIVTKSLISPFLTKEFGDEILQSYIIIIRERPRTPIINHVSNDSICFNGSREEPLLRYNITIKLSFAEISYNFSKVVNSTDDQCLQIPPEAEAIMSTDCAQQEITVFTENSVGLSDPTSTYFGNVTDNSHNSTCECIKDVVNIKLTQTNSDATSISLNVECSQQYNLRYMNFTIHLNDSKIHETKCSQTILFTGLKPSSSYSANISIKSQNLENDCIYFYNHKYQTKDNESDLITEDIYRTAIGILFTIVIAFIGGIIIYCIKKKCKKRRESRAVQQRPDLHDDQERHEGPVQQSLQEEEDTPEDEQEGEDL